MIFELTEGDTSPPLRGILKDADGKVAKVLVGDTVHFRMRPKSRGLRAPIDAVATVNDPDAGDVQYDWGSADTDTPGVYEAQFHISRAGAYEKSFPNSEYIDVIIREAA